jgi:hypothetical protein
MIHPYSGPSVTTTKAQVEEVYGAEQKTPSFANSTFQG